MARTRWNPPPLTDEEKHDALMCVLIVLLVALFFLSAK